MCLQICVFLFKDYTVTSKLLLAAKHKLQPEIPENQFGKSHLRQRLFAHVVFSTIYRVVFFFWRMRTSRIKTNDLRA